MNMEEHWKEIEGYPGYLISDQGRVKNVRTGRILKPAKDRNGYLQRVLSKDGKLKTFRVHRLVAQTFLPNPEQLPQVNHIDEDKSNNRVSNLEWCTQKYNVNYGTARERQIEKRSKPVICFELNGNIVKIFSSATEAEMEGYGHREHIYSCCRGKLKTAGGYQWSYFNEQKQADGCR